MAPNTNPNTISLVLTDDTEYIRLRPILILAALGYSVDLNCQLNDPSVDVHLIQERKVTGSTKTIELERAPDGIKVTQSGQIFTINNLEESDNGTYYCKAQSTYLRIERIYTTKCGSTQGNQFVCNMLR